VLENKRQRRRPVVRFDVVDHLSLESFKLRARIVHRHRQSSIFTLRERRDLTKPLLSRSPALTRRARRVRVAHARLPPQGL